MPTDFSKPIIDHTEVLCVAVAEKDGELCISVDEEAAWEGEGEWGFGGTGEGSVTSGQLRAATDQRAVARGQELWFPSPLICTGSARVKLATDANVGNGQPGLSLQCRPHTHAGIFWWRIV